MEGDADCVGGKGERGGCEDGGTTVGRNLRQPLKLGMGRVREGSGMGGVAVEGRGSTQNPDCEGSIPVHN